MATKPIDVASVTEELALFIKDVVDYAMFLLGPNGEIRSWNLGATRIMGYEAEEAVGSNFSRFYTPEDLASDKPGRELREAREAGRVEVEGWRVRKDGTRFWANTIITALRGSDGQLRGFVKITRDMTNHRMAEETLRRSEEMFRLLVASVQDYAIFMLDPEGRVTTWNHGAERIKGYTPEEIIGKHFSAFYTPEDRAAHKPEHNLELARTHGSMEDEGWRVRKDGTRFWANVVITAVHDDSGVLRGFAKVTRDVTSRRDAEETRRALFEQREARLRAEEAKHRAETSFRAAQEANRAKDEFLMTLSHELRTPMTAIIGWSRMLPSIPPGDPMFPEAIRSIARSATLQAKLIDDVLDVSRIVSGKLRLEVAEVDLHGILRSATDAVRPSADAKGIQLVSSIAPDIGTATVDPTRLQQIVWNLLSNAVKFTPRGGSVELSASRSDTSIQISVKDTGEGIDPDFLPHVFEPFKQAESPSTRVHGGLGLGLSIVRYLAEAHGGTASAESSGRGKGARFTVTLPAVAVRLSGDDAAQVRSRKIMPPLHGRQILVVDDDREGRELVAAALRYAGADVVAVDSAAAALSYVANQSPDLILTDIAMPEMDGYALQRKLRERDDLARTKIVALTAFPASAVSANEEEFDSYLRKPIDPFELTEKIGLILGV
ncbi:MAG TPA: PAS domain S-box protein [Thermoanaerobaculia bacterium]|nr:PAS domain S-box protein [Thermoanaerobaculia bacterium]